MKVIPCIRPHTHPKTTTHKPVFVIVFWWREQNEACYALDCNMQTMNGHFSWIHCVFQTRSNQIRMHTCYTFDFEMTERKFSIYKFSKCVLSQYVCEYINNDGMFQCKIVCLCADTPHSVDEKFRLSVKRMQRMKSWRVPRLSVVFGFPFVFHCGCVCVFAEPRCFSLKMTRKMSCGAGVCVCTQNGHAKTNFKLWSEKPMWK